MNNSIIQDWAAELGLRHQGVLVSAIRGCDGMLREDSSKHLVRFYRACLLKSHCEHPRDASSYMIWPKDCQNLRQWDYEFKKGGFDHYPMHWLTHFIFAAEIVGYHYPETCPLDSTVPVKHFWGLFYKRMVRRLHLNPETKEELDARLGANEQTFAKIQAENH